MTELRCRKPRPYSRESPVEIPKEYCETYVVRKPMGARIHKSDCRVSAIANIKKWKLGSDYVAMGIKFQKSTTYVAN
ncbi:unnamed protein product [Haemonchus placei]|uniref:60S ribosomal protein L31 n=1 Tax=Haemonchus placei TaxID=6290 RepID=A0A0N4X8P4_HAEPC|nr:unnamed protein product [Haemonchus placei]